MKMTHKLLAILLVLSMMCVVLISCNGNKNPTPNGPGGNTPGGNTPGTTQAPEKEQTVTKYGNFATDIPVRTLEEIFAEQVKNTESTFASGSSYSDEKLKNIDQIAGYIANYEQFVEEYDAQDELDQLYEETGFTLDMGFGAAMIKHYIDRSGETYDYTHMMPEMLEHPKVSAAQSTTISAAMKAAENLVKDGQSGVTINQNTPLNFGSLRSTDGTIYFALGTYHTMADLSNVQRTGDSYSATVTFRIVDYYDWDVNGKEPEFTTYLDKLNDSYRTLIGEMMDMPTLEGFCQADLAQLHYAGFAQNFLAHGTVVYNVTWTAGQSFDQATVTPAQ